jgi:hypothetical protein
MVSTTSSMPSNGVSQKVNSYQIPQTIQPQVFIMIHQWSSLQIEWLVYLSYASILNFNILHKLGGNVKKGLGTSKHLWVNATKLIP